MSEHNISKMIEEAQSFIEHGRFPEAKSVYEQICQLDKENAEAWKMLGAIHGELGNMADAVSCLRRATALRPDFPQAHFNLGNVLRMQGKLQEALASYQAAVKVAPDYVAAWIIMANIYGRLGVFDKSEDSCRKAIALQPDSVDAHINLANALLYQGKVEDAAAGYQVVVGLQPDLAVAWLMLGRTQSQLGRFDEAESSCRQAITLHPDSQDAHFTLGTALQSQGKTKDSMASYRHVIQINPDYSAAYNKLADIHRNQGNYQEAAANYRQVLRLNPDDPEINHFLATVGGTAVPDTAPPEYVAKLFDEYADHFDKHLVKTLDYQIPEYLNKALRKLIGQTRAEYNVLDLGCGTGLCGPIFRDIATRLVGVDLSPKMIDKARARNVYDELYTSDISEVLQSATISYDLIIAADVFVYIGALTSIFDACKTALKPGGLLAFSVESAEKDESWILRTSGRYAHSISYIRSLALAAGLQEISIDHVTVRTQKSNPIPGHIFILSRPD